MIAAFLKADDGGFDYPALMISAFGVVATVGVFFALVRAIRTGQALLILALPRGGSLGRIVIEREKNPIGFWVVVVLYVLGMVLISYLTVGWCFGLSRKPS